MQKDGGAGKNKLSCETEKEERLGGSASPLRSDRLADLSKASYFLLKQTALLF